MEEEKKHEGKKKHEGACSWKCSHAKKGAIIAGVLIVCALAFYFKGFFVAATVDGYPIGRFAVISETEKQAGKTALENLITKKIVESEIAKQGVKISEDEINAEVTRIETMIKAQGGTLDQALAAQGITKADLISQIAIQKKVEKLITVKPTVTDQEVKEYISSNKITIPAGKEDSYRSEIKSQMEQQKMNEAITALVTSLKAKATVRYFVDYK
ncbi:MAG: SurA N-terminal domain-containing protein [Candidatus Parcubacteria bacterium]|nr:SurA N-terminal domain-containing protein [Candidatus Parcubacteria bacterium]